ncbi:MAG: archaellin/type IV pilin N-terminal domain-containing protein [Candidatus Nanohaloarchaea archaeon]
MKSKGISPLIAAVLLIAFTMAIASLFARWAPRLMENMQQDSTNQSQQIRNCVGVDMEVIQSSFSSEVASITVQQTAGSRSVGELTVTWYYSGSTGIVQNSTGISIDTTRGTTTVERNEVSGEEPVEKIKVSPVNCHGASALEFER